MTTPPREDGLYVVRRYGYALTHLAEIDRADISENMFFGALANVVDSPLTTLCLTTLKDRRRGVIVMQPRTRVRCGACQRLAAKR